MAARCIAKSCSQLMSRPSPATQAFLRISGRRQFHNTPPLDFLVPSIAAVSFKPTRSARRNFGSSSSRWATITVINPRQDEDGKEMLVEITPRASNRLKEIMKKDSNPNLALRISVESGGCHGFQYLMSLTTLPQHTQSSSNNIAEETPPALNTSSSDPNAMPSQDLGSPATSASSSPTTSGASTENTDTTEIPDEEDTIFTTDDGSGAKIVMDGPSLELLKGSKVDFTMELIGSQFKIVDNPLATSSCGCGTSFDIKS